MAAKLDEFELVVQNVVLDASVEGALFANEDSVIGNCLNGLFFSSFDGEVGGFCKAVWVSSLALELFALQGSGHSFGAHAEVRLLLGSGWVFCPHCCPFLQVMVPSSAMSQFPRPRIFLLMLQVTMAAFSSAKRGSWDLS